MIIPQGAVLEDEEAKEEEGKSSVTEGLMRYLIVDDDHDTSNMRHEDFDVSCEEYSIFHVEDYNWQDNGVPQLDRCYRGCGTMLDVEFRTTFNLTYNTFNDEKEMDTQPFRHAIWFYVQRISGIFNDYYDYQEVSYEFHKNKQSLAPVVNKLDPLTLSIAPGEFNATTGSQKIL